MFEKIVLEIKAVDEGDSAGVDMTGREWWASREAQLVLPIPSGNVVQGGWYRISLDIRDNDSNAPFLYVDYGRGVHEHDGISLRDLRVSEGRYEGLVRLSGTVRSFFLGLEPVEGSVGQLTVQRLHKGHAAAEMLIGIMRRRRGKRAKLRVVLRAIESLLKGGVGGLGEALYYEYTTHPSFDETEEYEQWCYLYPQGSRRAANTEGPLISVLMPVYNTPEKWLRRSVRSMIEQSYRNWELCIADDASTQPHVRQVLEELSASDPRIKVEFRSENGHISVASNTALAVATGRYIALLDHDDELPSDALAEVADALLRFPEWRMLYTDEDKIDEKGRRYDPYFKPDWNYELLLSQNCFSHFGVFDASLVREVGGFRVGLEGSQDWDLVLRCCELVQPDEIGHIPRVLYHWRAIPGSAALDVGEKSYAVMAGRQAVVDHLERIGQAADVELTDWGHCRVRFTVSKPEPLVSLVIPTRDGVDLLRTCVDSILNRTSYLNYEVIVVDNQSSCTRTIKYFEEISEDPRVRIVKYDAPFNYSAINNHAVGIARGSIIGLINNDIEVISRDWLDEMVGHASRPMVGAVGAMLYYPDDTIQHGGVITGIGGVAGHAYLGKPRGFGGQMYRAKLAQSLSAVTGACLVVRRRVYEEVGGLDEALKVAFNDVDFCLRIRAAGYRNVWTPWAELYHHESATRGYEDTPEKKARFQQEVEFMQARWGHTLQHDPAYNPNLALDKELFSLAFPPRACAWLGADAASSVER